MKNKKILSLIFSGILSVGVVTPILSSYVNLHDVKKISYFYHWKHKLGLITNKLKNN